MLLIITVSSSAGKRECN